VKLRREEDTSTGKPVGYTVKIQTQSHPDHRGTPCYVGKYHRTLNDMLLNGV